MTRYLAALVLAVCSAAVLTACGGGGPDDNPTDAGSQPVTCDHTAPSCAH